MDIETTVKRKKNDPRLDTNRLKKMIVYLRNDHTLDQIQTKFGISQTTIFRDFRRLNNLYDIKIVRIVGQTGQAYYTWLQKNSEKELDKLSQVG